MKVFTTKEGLEIAIQLYYLHVIIKSNSMIALLLIEKNKFLIQRINLVKLKHTFRESNKIVHK